MNASSDDEYGTLGPTTVQIASLEGGSGGRNRPIRGRRTIAENLTDREDDIKAAVTTCAHMLSEASVQSESQSADGLKVSEISATFGLVITSEGSIIVSKASIEASLEISITLQRS